MKHEGKIEVIQRTERKRWSLEQKKFIVEETYAPGVSVSYVARKHGVSPAQLFLWRKCYQEGGVAGVMSQDKVVPLNELKQLEVRVKRLERLLGRKTEEVEILKEAVRIGREKKLISRQPLQGIEDFE
jgi:transposase